jgi:hypothetical protein
MGQAKTLDVRQRVVTMKQGGHTNAQIAEALPIGIGTVKNIWKRFQTGGEAGLPASYERCGNRVAWSDEVAFRLVRLVRHFHQAWGVPLIMVKLSAKYPDLKLRSIRQYQRRLSEGSNKLPRPILPPTPVAEQSRLAHDCWQIDAKERFFIQNGQEVCYLTIMDEGTGSLLAARAFPPSSDQSSSANADPTVSVGTISVLDHA